MHRKGMGVFELKRTMKHTYVSLLSSIASGGGAVRRDLVSPGFSHSTIVGCAPDLGTLRCSLLAGYKMPVPGKPSIFQLLVEFRHGHAHRDLVVFETADASFKSWRILKFM